MLKELLKKAISEDYKKFPDMPVWLEFSAGCDSIALLIAMSELHKPFSCITYYFLQSKIYLNKIYSITKMFKVDLKIISLSKEDILQNWTELKNKGYKSRIELDCLAGHLPIAKKLNKCLVVNGAYADIMYGSYFFQFRGCKTLEDFNIQRQQLLLRTNQDTVHSLYHIFLEYDNQISTPFGYPIVRDYFFSKTFEECGGIKKTLFKKEFQYELKNIPFRIRCQSQQIESGIRDFRKSLTKKCAE